MFSLSGILLNHRKLISAIDINRKYLPTRYHYKNWNNAAVKSTVNISADSILIYGNIGIYLTDSTFRDFKPFNKGLPAGVDNRKIKTIYKTKDGNLYAATYWELYQYRKQKWQQIPLPLKKTRIVTICEKKDTLLILTRSFLLKEQQKHQFQVIQLPPPTNYQNKVSLFKTIWILHSGEILGITGKILVDIIAIIFIFLSITGLIIFLKRKKKTKRSKQQLKWNLKWHNKIGWITFILLFFITLTGMFLRPPLLIPIANAKIGKIPFSSLDNNNPWHDQLRAMIYDTEKQTYIFGTSKGFFKTDSSLKHKLIKIKQQPPISVMGINVFEKKKSQNYIVGSFAGIFEWKLDKKTITNKVTNKQYKQKTTHGKPIGNEIISGYISNFNGKEIFFDYFEGAYAKHHEKLFVKMPKNITNTHMSLWNIALEIHTARIFSSIINDFYILIIPLAGITILFVLISGIIIWIKTHK